MDLSLFLALLSNAVFISHNDHFLRIEGDYGTSVLWRSSDKIEFTIMNGTAFTRYNYPATSNFSFNWKQREINGKPMELIDGEEIYEINPINATFLGDFTIKLTSESLPLPYTTPIGESYTTDLMYVGICIILLVATKVDLKNIKRFIAMALYQEIATTSDQSLSV